MVLIIILYFIKVMVLNELGEEVDVYHKKFGKACCRFPEMVIGDVLFEGVGLGSRN